MITEGKIKTNIKELSKNSTRPSLPPPSPKPCNDRLVCYPHGECPLKDKCLWRDVPHRDETCADVEKFDDDGWPCAFCIHCGCIDTGDGLCESCKSCKRCNGCEGSQDDDGLKEEVSA